MLRRLWYCVVCAAASVSRFRSTSAILFLRVAQDYVTVAQLTTLLHRCLLQAGLCPVYYFDHSGVELKDPKHETRVRVPSVCRAYCVCVRLRLQFWSCCSLLRVNLLCEHSWFGKGKMLTSCFPYWINFGAME